MSDVPAVTPPAPWFRPRQRILQRNGRRVSLKLEEEFWEILELAAKDERIKLTDLIFRTMEDHPTANKSSLLRAFGGHWMRRKLVATQLASTNANIQGILSSCPLPCVIVTHEKKLIAQNSAFTERVLGTLISTVEAEDTVVRFSLGRPIAHIIRDLENGQKPFTETNVAFARGSKLVQFVGRFCLLSLRSGETSPLLCYLYPKAR